MNKENLQKALDEKGIIAKVLYVQKTEYEDYEVVYTFDIDYQGRDSYEDYIVEPELDELVEDIEEAVFMIGLKYKKKTV
jgi:hypothetical protein